MDAQRTGVALLIAWRTGLGLNQAQAAAKLVIPASTLSALEQGTRKPGLKLAMKLRDAIGIPLEAWTLTGGEPADALATDAEPPTMLPPRLPTIPREQLSTIPPPVTRRPSSRPPPSRPSEPPTPSDVPLFIKGTNNPEELDEFGNALGEVFGDPVDDDEGER